MGRMATGVAGAYSRAMAGEVRAELARRGLDQNRLAEATGLTTSYLSTRLRGERPFNLNDIEDIANALDMSPLLLMQRAESAVKGRDTSDDPIDVRPVPQEQLDRFEKSLRRRPNAQG
jgi:transcriptional regulator with XRE-family HTH domain